MTRVDFYVLTPETANTQASVACKLAEKGYLAGQNVYLYAPQARLAQEVDEHLWTFRPGSFVPHGRVPGEAASTPVLIGEGAPPANMSKQLLITMADEVPEFFSEFERVIEIVGPSDEARTASRTRFRRYREAQCELHTHQLGA